MFSNDPSHMPIRARRDLQRAAQMRAMISNSNRPGSQYGLDPLNRRAGLGHRNSFNGRSGSFPPPYYGLGSPFTPSSAYTAPFSPSLRSPTPASTSSGYRPGRSRSGRVLATFAKAARTLYDALDPAMTFNLHFEGDFASEVGPLHAYIEPKLIEHLWRAKVEWDGVDKWTQYTEGARPRADCLTFGDHAARLLDAMDTWRENGHISPRDTYELDGKMSPQDVMTTVQKLDISLQAIEGLLEAVRMDRKRHQALVKELRSAHALLGDLQELWKQTPERRHRR